MWRLWYNGTVASMDGAMRRYEVMDVEDGRLTFLGSVQEALAQEWDEARDLQGAMVLPGFTGFHVHPLYYVMTQGSLSLFGVASIGEIIEWGRIWIEQDHPSYLIGMGWNQETMVEGRLVTREDLDRISVDIPVCILRACLHIGVYNPVMPKRIRVLEDVAPEVPALVDFANDILWEGAARLYTKVLPQTDDVYVKGLIRLDQWDLNVAGITCINSDDLKAIAGVDPIRLVDIFREMGTDRELMVRVHEQYLVELEDLEWFQAARGGPADREGLFHTGPHKLLQGGSLGAKPTEMVDGYLDESDSRDIPIYTKEELCSRIRAAHTAHMDVAVHTIGDPAFRRVYDAIGRAEQEEPWPDHCHGIVRAQTAVPALLERVKALGLQAYIQSALIDADVNIIAERVRETHAKECYNWRTMEDLGIQVSDNSDCPAESFNVLSNLRVIVTRQNRVGTRVYLPGQALTMGQTARLPTSDVTWVSRDEAIRGILELGKQADLVVLNRDLSKIFHRGLNRVKVLETVLNDATVYRAEALQSVHSLDHRQ